MKKPEKHLVNGIDLLFKFASKQQSARGHFYFVGGQKVRGSLSAFKSTFGQGYGTNFSNWKNSRNKYPAFLLTETLKLRKIFNGKFTDGPEDKKPYEEIVKLWRKTYSNELGQILSGLDRHLAYLRSELAQQDIERIAEQIAKSDQERKLAIQLADAQEYSGTINPKPVSIENAVLDNVYLMWGNHTNVLEFDVVYNKVPIAVPPEVGKLYKQLARKAKLDAKSRGANYFNGPNTRLIRVVPRMSGFSTNWTGCMT